MVFCKSQHMKKNLTFKILSKLTFNMGSKGYDYQNQKLTTIIIEAEKNEKIDKLYSMKIGIGSQNQYHM